MDAQDAHILPTVKLIGDPIENFYKLGRIDKNTYRPVIEEINAILQTPWDTVNKTVHEAGLILIKNTISSNSSFRKHLEAYAQGLETSFEEIALSFLAPEIINSMAKLAPTFSTKNLGCSSTFFIDEKNKNPIHIRFADFPLVGSFDKYERTLITQFTNEIPVYSFGTSGLPYSAFSCMNAKGVTLAIHQNHEPIFNIRGTPIFELANELITQIKNPEEAIEILNKRQSISNWGMYLLFSDGQVLAIDLLGEKFEHKIYELKENHILSFNNLPLYHKRSYEKNIPSNFVNYCKMRSHSEQKKIKRLRKESPLTEENMLKALATAKRANIENLEKWEADNITLTTVSAVSFNPSKNHALFIPGDAPKYYSGKLLKVSFFKNDIKQKLFIEEDVAATDRWNEGMRRMALAVQFYQKKSPHQTYHHMQIACELLKNSPEQKIAHLYFAFYRYLNEEDLKLREDILIKLHELKHNLPSYLHDHCLLFIWRLERLLGKKSKITATLIENKELQNLLEKESKIPKILLYKVTAPFTHPRPDILDVTYSYALTH